MYTFKCLNIRVDRLIVAEMNAELNARNIPTNWIDFCSVVSYLSTQILPVNSTTRLDGQNSFYIINRSKMIGETKLGKTS